MFASWHIYRAHIHTHTRIQPYQSSQTCTWWKKTKDGMSINSSMLSSWRHHSQWKHHIAFARFRKTTLRNLQHGPGPFCFGFVSQVKVRKTGKNCATGKNAAFHKEKDFKPPPGVWQERTASWQHRKYWPKLSFCFPVSPPWVTNTNERVRNKKWAARVSKAMAPQRKMEWINSFTHQTTLSANWN